MSMLFTLIAFILFICIVVEFWPLFLFLLISFFALIIVLIVRSCRQNTNIEITEDDYFSNSNYKQKIGAEVNGIFYNEITQYCSKHHMTISDLIRKSVRAYMDANR